MNNTILAGLIVGGAAVAAGAAIAVNSGFNPLQKYATVVAVEPAFETNRVPRVACGEDARLALAQTPANAPANETPPAPAAESPANAELAEDDCVTVYDTESIEAGYDVTYELDGVQRIIRMDHDPGERIPVENGEPVLGRS